jgi:predicted nucleic-acid-binding Zn-ribbon protein
VTDEDFNSVSNEANTSETFSDLSIVEVIENKFKCSKCTGTDCTVKEVAMTGTGLSKLFDIQHNHFLFVSCTSCGFVEVYDPDVLQGLKSGRLGTVMDILFGS